jgi:hypothetical protein
MKEEYLNKQRIAGQPKKAATLPIGKIEEHGKKHTETD